MLVAGVIYNVVRDELFWAERGQGAYLNDRRLRVAGRADMRDALFACGTPFHGKGGHDVALAEIGRVIERTAGIRRPAPLHSISRTSLRGASMASGNGTSASGISQPAPCWCAKLAAS